MRMHCWLGHWDSVCTLYSRILQRVVTTISACKLQGVRTPPSRRRATWLADARQASLIVDHAGLNRGSCGGEEERLVGLVNRLLVLERL